MYSQDMTYLWSVCLSRLPQRSGHLDDEVIDDQAGNGRAEFETQLVGAIGSALGCAGQGQAVAKGEQRLRMQGDSVLQQTRANL